MHPKDEGKTPRAAWDLQKHAAFVAAALLCVWTWMPAQALYVDASVLTVLSAAVLWLCLSAARVATAVPCVRTGSLLALFVFLIIMGGLIQVGLLPMQGRPFPLLLGLSLVAAIGFAQRPVRVAARIPSELRGDAEFLLAAGCRSATVLRLLLPSPPLRQRVMLTGAAVLILYVIHHLGWLKGLADQPFGKLTLATLITIVVASLIRLVLEFLLANSLFLDGRLPEIEGRSPTPHFEVGESPVPAGPPVAAFQERPDASASQGFAALFRPDGGTENRS